MDPANFGGPFDEQEAPQIGLARRLPVRATRPMMEGRLPNLVVIGSYKAGTTSLYSYLNAHPQVFMAPNKEPNFFSRDWERGVGWYRTQFASADDQVIVGEASTSYTRWPTWDASEHMAAVIPDARLIYLLRHPVERLISQYRYDKFHFYEPGPIDQAVLQYEGFLAYSMYSMQLERFLRLFPREHILLMTSEELRTNREASLERLWGFLGVSPPAVAIAPEDLNSADEQRRDRHLFTRIRRLPLYRAASRLAPSAIRHELWRAVGSTRIDPMLVQASVTDATRLAVVERLRPDLERLPDHFGHAFDCWGLLDDALARPG
jgi:hypothetical protein